MLKKNCIPWVWLPYHGSLIIVAFLLLMVPWETARAGGLYLQEFGTPSMGVASAGAEAVAVDASAAWHNPAGMTRVEGKQLMLTGGLLYSRVKFDQDSGNIVNGSNGDDAGGPVPMGGGFYTHSLTENFRLGLSFHSISGSALDYDNDWIGRYQCEEVSILTVNFTPTLAYRVNDWLSIGGGPSIMYGKLEMDVAAPPPAGNGRIKLDGDDVEVGFILGTLFELTERTRLGVIYASGWDLEFDGDLKLKGLGINAGIDTDLPLAQTVRAGIYHELNDRFALLGTVAWEDWSELDSVTISTGTRGAALPKKWEDVWHFAAGLHYRPSKTWLLQCGLAYDTSPVDSDDRTADMPIDRQIRYAVGAQRAWSDKLSIGAQFEYIDLGDAEIDSTLFSGDYKTNDLFVFALNFNYKF